MEFKTPISLKKEHEELHTMLKQATQLSGKTGEAAKTVAEFAEKNHIGFSAIACRYIIANQFDKAMDSIEKGFESHDPVMTYVTKSAQIFEPFFGNPRFIAICEKMKIPLPKSN